MRIIDVKSLDDFSRAEMQFGPKSIVFWFFFFLIYWLEKKSSDPGQLPQDQTTKEQKW